LVSKLSELCQKIASIGRELLGRQPFHILKKNRARLGVRDDLEGCRKHVSLVVAPKLLTRNAERGARYATRYEIYVGEMPSIQLPYVGLPNVPMRTVFP
jgi:hypothetical protein